MQRDANAGLDARRSTFPGLLRRGGRLRGPRRPCRLRGLRGPRGLHGPRRLRRPRRPRRITIYLGLMAVLARVFDIAVVLRRARRGPWRAEVAEESMVPALLPGDWLLLDPTCRRWPRVGSIVVVREPATGILAIKRVARRGARGGLGSREAWLVGDAAEGSIDSRRYGPLDADDLVARAWFRYGPRHRIGRLG